MDSNELKGWRRWVHPGKIRYRGYEWLVMRVLFAVVAWPTFDPRGLQAFQSLSDPHGLARFFEMDWMLQSNVQSLLLWISAIHIICYVLNVVPLWTCSVLLVVHTLIGTVVNSQGAIHHTSQIVAFALLGQLIAYVAYLLQKKSSLALGWKQLEIPGRLGSEAPALPIYLAQQLMATAYVVSAISKLIRSEGEWISSLPNIALQLQKTRMMAHYNTLEPIPEVAGWAITMVREFPKLAMAFFAMGLLLELFAFVGLFNRLFLALTGAGLMLMHVAISQVMNLGFFYNKWLLIIFWINIPFWIVVALRWKKADQSPETSTHAP